MKMYTMLIVDDEKVERMGIEMLLKRLELPIRADMAENGEKALDMLERKHYDLLLTDIKMPFMDGLTLAHQARERYPELVILIFSAYADFEKAQTAIREQVYRYLLKPVNIREFETTMNACIGDLERLRNEAAKRNILASSVSQYRRKEALLRSTISDKETIPREALVGLLEDEKETDNAPEAASDNPIVKKVLEIVAKEYMNDISVETVASRLYLTPNYLSALFSKHMGISYVKYLNNYRLDIAASALADTNQKIVDIAAQSGFSCDSYFVTLFKQRFGLTPSAYRTKQ